MFSSEKSSEPHLYRLNYKVHSNNAENKKDLTSQSLLIISRLSLMTIINRDSMFRIWDFFILML